MVQFNYYNLLGWLGGVNVSIALLLPGRSKTENECNLQDFGKYGTNLHPWMCLVNFKSYAGICAFINICDVKV